MSFQGINIRATTDRILFRTLLQDGAGAKVTTGTTTLRLFEVQSAGPLKSYDFSDNTFKTTALSTPTLAMLHRTGDNATFDTGIWTVAHTTLTGFTKGSIYLAEINNTGAIPLDKVQDFQFGNAEGDLTVSAAGDLASLTTGFTASNPENLRSYVAALMSKAATVPSGLGTFNPATDAVEVLRERIDLIEGAGFATSTDSLQAIRDAIDTLVAPSIVSSSSSSGSGFIADVISMVRRAVDEPTTTPKYTNADIMEFVSGAFDVILADVNINTDAPILVRLVINIMPGVQTYTLPPNVATIYRVAHINQNTKLPEWELWPGSELSGHGHGFSLEGNTLRLMFDWQQTQTVQILYVPNSEVYFHRGTIPDASVTTDVTATTIKFTSSPTAGSLDTRKNCYAGYMVRLLTSNVGRVEERIITAYDNVTQIATIDEPWDTTPGAGTDLVYETIPQYSRLLKHVVILRAALDILAQEGNSKRMQTLTASLQVKMAALRRFIGSKQGRFPHSLSGDTMDNVNRGYWGGGWGGTDLL